MAKNSNVDRFIELRLSGLSYERIARELHVSKPTLIAWSAKYQGRLQAAQVAHSEAFLEEIRLSSKDMARSLAARIALVQSKFEAALDEADLEVHELLDLEERLLGASCQVTGGATPIFQRRSLEAAELNRSFTESLPSPLSFSEKAIDGSESTHRR